MSGPSAAELEHQYTQCLLACLVFEIQVNYVERIDKDEDPPGDFFDILAALIEYAPPEVMSLVEHLKRRPSQARQGNLYIYSFPFAQVERRE